MEHNFIACLILYSLPCIVVSALAGMRDASKMIIYHTAVQFSLSVQIQNHKVLEVNEDAVILKVQIHQNQVSVAIH